MNDIGFKSGPEMSMSQLSIALLFFVALFGVAYLLRHRKENIKHWISKSSDQQKHSQVDVQKIEQSVSLYRIKSGDNEYLVIRSPEGMVQLKKEV